MTDAAPPLPAVQTLVLTRTYGAITALNSLDLTILRGDLFGFIGSNGAGKTTTLRILATFLAPSAGQAIVLGKDVVQDADAVRHVIGYMPDFFGVQRHGGDRVSGFLRRVLQNPHRPARENGERRARTRRAERKERRAHRRLEPGDAATARPGAGV